MISGERLLSTFSEYVQIDSESGHEGLMAARIAADLEAIGCQIAWDDSQAKTGSETGNLYCTLPGNGEGETILFSAHMDTVVPGVDVKPVIEYGIIRSQGDTVLGTGMDKVHTTQEKISIQNLEGTAALVLALATM